MKEYIESLGYAVSYDKGALIVKNGDKTLRLSPNLIGSTSKEYVAIMIKEAFK